MTDRSGLSKRQKFRIIFFLNRNFKLLIKNVYFTGHVKYGMQEDNERLINKRRRTIFTTSQLERLEYEFQHQQYIVGQERRYLAKQLGLNEIQVKVWFQNRRIKWRKFTHGNTNMPELSMWYKYWAMQL